jgi:hypothetical protein
MVAGSEKVIVKYKTDERGGFKPKASLSLACMIISIMPFALADATSRVR